MLVQKHIYFNKSKSFCSVGNACFAIFNIPHIKGHRLTFPLTDSCLQMFLTSLYDVCGEREGHTINLTPYPSIQRFSLSLRQAAWLSTLPRLYKLGWQNNAVLTAQNRSCNVIRHADTARERRCCMCSPPPCDAADGADAEGVREERRAGITPLTSSWETTPLAGSHIGAALFTATLTALNN